VNQGDLAGFPETAQCRVCHLQPDWPAPAEIPSRRVQEQRDYVVFSHAKHTVAAKIDCSACHGQVLARDVLTMEVKHNMKWCMDCHRQQKATLACNACHELGQ
jgi:hypothetical protein